PAALCCRERLRDVSEGWNGSLVEAEKKNGEKIASLHVFNYRFTDAAAPVHGEYVCNESSPAMSQCCCENRRTSGTCQAVALSSERAHLLASA
ncbi:hypothetical protein FQN60_011882, partial [Etheostoma spectabile]